jgi:hypothetical protein
VFSDADESALSIIPSDRSTRYSFEGNRMSVEPDMGDVQYIRFSFEDALFTSHVYKRNYRFPTMKPRIDADDHSEPPTRRTTEPDTKESDVETKDEDHDDGVKSRDAQSPRIVSANINPMSGDLRATPNLLPVKMLSSMDSVRNAMTPSSLQSLSKITKARNEADKKLMLSRALEMAYRAVALDNAFNHVEAMKFYVASCSSLHQVMIKCSRLEDQEKLEAIVSTLQAVCPMTNQWSIANHVFQSPHRASVFASDKVQRRHCAFEGYECEEHRLG